MDIAPLTGDDTSGEPTSNRNPKSPSSPARLSTILQGSSRRSRGSYAELVTKYPRAGGAAVFAERAFKNKLVSFLVGFSMLAAGVTSAAGLSIAFAGQYLQTFADLPVVPVAIIFLAVLAALNARGIRESMGANFVMTAIEVSGLVIVVVVVGFLLAGGGAEILYVCC